MKYRILVVLLCAALMLTLTACADEYEPELEPETLPETIEPEPDCDDELESYGDFEEEMTDADYHGLPDDLELPEMTDEHNPELVAAFTPEDAYVHSDWDSTLILTSHMSKDELTDFVMAAAEELGIVFTDVEEPWEGAVEYTGILADGNPIHIQLRDNGDGTVNLMMIY